MLTEHDHHEVCKCLYKSLSAEWDEFRIYNEHIQIA